MEKVINKKGNLSNVNQKKDDSIRFLISTEDKKAFQLKCKEEEFKGITESNIGRILFKGFVDGKFKIKK